MPKVPKIYMGVIVNFDSEIFFPFTLTQIRFGWKGVELNMSFLNLLSIII
jgi:hypothetical protein